MGLLLLDAWARDGTTRVTLEIAARLAQHHDVEVISLLRTAETPCFAFPEGVMVTALDDRTTPRHGVLARLPSALVPPDAPASAVCTLATDALLARHLGATRPAALIGSRPGLTLAALALAAPGTSVAAHERRRFTARPPGLQRLMAARYPALDALIVETRDAEQMLLRALAPRSAPVVRIPPATRELAGPPPTLTDRVILAAGRLDSRADFATLVDAFALVNLRHPHWQLRICGDGPARAALAARAGALGLGARVSLPGAVSTLGEEMGGASVFVSAAPPEDLPLALVEAMGKGLPVVAAGPRETVRDGANGRLVTPSTPESLAAALIELIEDERLRRRCGAEAAETARGYRMELVGPQWDGLVASLAEAGAGRANARPRLRPAVAGQTAPSSSSVGSS